MAPASDGRHRSIDFVPTGASVTFDDGEGGSSLDEWQMVMNLGDARIPLSRGVSVRRYRKGWITWACDVYDTAAFRQPPPPDMAGIPGLPSEPPPSPLSPSPPLRRRGFPNDERPKSRAHGTEGHPLVSGSWHVVRRRAQLHHGGTKRPFCDG